MRALIWLLCLLLTVAPADAQRRRLELMNDGVASSLDLNFAKWAGKTAIDPRIAFARASVANYWNSAGVLTSVGNNVPRLDFNPTTGTFNGLLIEESRTNVIINNTMVGASAGTLPTNWSRGADTSGITSTVVGAGTENGVNYLDISYVGTNLSGSTVFPNVAPANASAASDGQIWTSSVFLKLQSGTSQSVQNSILEYTSGGTYLTQHNVGTHTVTSSALSTQRVSGSVTLNQATVGMIVQLIQFPVANGASINFTLRIGMPQLELGAFGTSVISTSSAAQTRTAEIASIATGLFPFYKNGGTLTASAIEANQPAASNAIIFYLDDNTLSNGLSSYISTGTLSNKILTTISGTTTVTTIGNVSLGTPFNVGLSFTNTGAMGSLSGSSPVLGSASVPISQFITLRLGSEVGGVTYLNGWITRLRYYPFAMNAQQLSGATR